MQIYRKGQTLRFLTLAIAIITALSFCLSGCAKKGLPPDEISTLKPLSNEKMPITVSVKHAFSINTFEEVVEKKFPNIDIVQIGNWGRNMGITEYEARLEHDDLTDIIMTWPIDVDEKYWDDRLIDLSGMEFTNKYNLSMLNEISRDGKLYYLPGPSQVRGILYNKTLFKENGWEVPEDFEGFIELCKTIEDSGIRSLQLGFANEEVLDTAFIGYSLTDCYRKPQDFQWLKEYNEGKHSFGDQYDRAFDTFQRLIDEGIFRESDLNVKYSDREKMLFTRKCAMIEDSALLANLAFEQGGTSDEFAIMPFFNPGEETDWARLYMVCYIGMNKHLAEDANKEKYDAVIELMNFISTPEGQDALMGDTEAMFSSLTDMEAPDAAIIADLLPALMEGRFTIFPKLKNASSAFRKGLAKILKKEATKEEVIKEIDAENISVKNVEEPKVFGTAKKDFTLIETGGFVADVMKEAVACDMALFLDNGKDGQINGKGISGRLYSGDITEIDIDRVLPVLKYGAAYDLCKGKITGANLRNALEYSIMLDNNNNWFYYFSGLKVEFDPSAQRGSRIKSVTLSDGSAIEDDKEYTVVFMEGTVASEYLSSSEKTDFSVEQLFIDKVVKEGVISPSTDNRFIISSDKK